MLTTIAGNIDITFGSINSDKPFSINSVSGDIDLAVPAEKQADLYFSTITGTVYSDLDIKHSAMHSSIPMKINEKLNNRGDPIKLETISGDIFFRKSN